MKKILILLFILSVSTLCVNASEIEEDYIDIAGNYCIVGDYTSAMQYLDQIIQMNPSNSQAAALRKGLSHIIANDKESFVANVNPDIKLASEFEKEGNEQKQYDVLLSATKGTGSYLGYYYLGHFYKEHGSYQKALDAYNSCVSERADFAPAYLSLAILLYDIGKYDSVLNPIDKYLTFSPDDDLAYAIKSRAEFALGMFAQSAADNDKAIQINDCPEYQFDRAKILYMNGSYDESKRIFKSLMNDIQTEKIYEYMGLCDYALKNYNDALLNFDKAIILSEDDEYLQSKYNEVKSILEDRHGENDG